LAKVRPTSGKARGTENHNDFSVPDAFLHVVRTLANSAGCILSVSVFPF
jgi:hypothetical protein